MKFFLLILLLVISSFPAVCQKGEGSRETILCDECRVRIESHDMNVNLGKFYIGTYDEELPGEGGTGNTISFRLFGEYNKKFNITATLQPRVKIQNGGEVVLSNIEWSALNRSNSCQYKTISTTESFSLNGMKLCKSDQVGCDGYASFKIRVGKITVPRDAFPGDYKFNILITSQLVNF